MSGAVYTFPADPSFGLGAPLSPRDIQFYTDAGCTQRATVATLDGVPLRDNVVVPTSAGLCPRFLGPSGAATLYGRQGSTGTVFTVPAAFASQSSAQTLSNKRITERVLALAANSATPAVNTDLYDVVHITAQTAAITSMTSGLTGTAVDGDELRVSITGTGSVGITWGASFEASTVALPTTTSSTARLDVRFVWNTETSKWRCAVVA